MEEEEGDDGRYHAGTSRPRFRRPFTLAEALRGRETLAPPVLVAVLGTRLLPWKMAQERPHHLLPQSLCVCLVAPLARRLRDRLIQARRVLQLRLRLLLRIRLGPPRHRHLRALGAEVDSDADEDDERRQIARRDRALGSSATRRVAVRLLLDRNGEPRLQRSLPCDIRVCSMWRRNMHSARALSLRYSELIKSIDRFEVRGGHLRVDVLRARLAVNDHARVSRARPATPSRSSNCSGVMHLPGIVLICSHTCSAISRRCTRPMFSRMYPQRHRRGARPTGQLQASSCRQLQTGRRIAENEQFENSTVLATPPFSTGLHYHATLFSTNCSFFFQTSENILCPKETDLMKVD